MLEVGFSDSVKGALAVAQNCKEAGGATSIAFVSDKKGIFTYLTKKKALREYENQRAELQNQAVSLGTSKNDVAGVCFGLSEGDIQTPITFRGCPRKDYIYSTFLFNCYNASEDIKKSIDAFWENAMADLERLKSKPEKIRVWLDHTPDAQCGLLFTADLLKDSHTEIHIIELPEKMKRADGCEIEYRSWGEVAPELFGSFLDRERVLSRRDTESLAAHWQTLRAENAPLRVMENGVAVSAKESYYDDLIRKEFPATTCEIAKIIGGALGKRKILTGDVFIAKRIQSFIESGELEVVKKTSKGLYSTVVRLAK